jgi:hypothetical protein
MAVRVYGGGGCIPPGQKAERDRIGPGTRYSQRDATSDLLPLAKPYLLKFPSPQNSDQLGT